MNEQRANQQRYRRAVPFHPILFAVTPIFFVYVHNAAKIPINPAQLLLPMALALAMTAVVWTIMGVALRSATRAALFVSLYLVLFFSYGHIAEAAGPVGRTWTDLLILWALLMSTGVWLAARRPGRRAGTSLFGLTVLVNTIAVSILLVNLPNGVRAYVHSRHGGGRRHAPAGALAEDNDYPDIYWIITDAYPRSDVLKSRCGVDNSAFLDELRRLGFFVAERARSNYAWTYPSLASSFNFTYLDSLAEAVGQESENSGPFLHLIQESRLVDFLQRRGYAVASFATGIEGIDPVGADVHFAPRWSLSEFHTILVNTTLLRDVLALTRRSSINQHRERVLYTLRCLPDAKLGRHPVFVFAHILCPHRPIIFGTPAMRPGLTSRAADYGGQVLFLNKLLLDVVRRILTQSSRPPVIIVQADHGMRGSIIWGDSARSQLLERHAILYAAHLPPASRETPPTAELYDSISSVNTFRVVLSTYFDTVMSLLPDRSYHSSLDRPYRFYDVNQPDRYPVLGEANTGR